MKSYMFIVALCLFFSATSLHAQSDKTVQFKVSGNCGMCQNTIQSSLQNQPGIRKASWDKKSKMMAVTYDSTKISEAKVHQAIAASGYDTEKQKASDKAYAGLPECCQYPRTLHAKK